MDIDTKRTPSESGLYGRVAASDSCRRSILAPAEAAGIRDTGVSQCEIQGSTPLGGADSQAPRTSTSVGDEISRWAVVEAVWYEQRPLVLKELSLEGPDHTYVANGLGTHNCLTPQMQKVMNAASDFRKKIEVPECGRVFRLKEGAKLWIVGTMNQSVYGGVYALNEDLKSRFRMIDLSYPEPKLEREIVLAVLKDSKITQEEMLKTVNLVITLAHETRQKALEYPLSTRDVIQIVEDIAYLGIERALRVSLGKFDGDDKNTVAERITSLFGVKVK